MKDTLKALCALDGVSGDEGRVAQYIREQLEGVCPVESDPLGNLIARRGEGGLAIFAHMDEVGLMVRFVEENGLLRFESIGMDLRVLCGRRVLVGEKRVPGVVGSRVLHHLSEKERGAPISPDEVWIDIGAASREEALGLVQPGDRAVPEGPFTQLGDKVLSKALDDRAGCAYLLRLLTETDLPVTAVFTVQEESGLAGAAAAAYRLLAGPCPPQRALVLEATTAGDLPGVEEGAQVCRQGAGPVLSFADRRTLYDRAFYRQLGKLAEENGIPWQPKLAIAGGNDAGAIHQSAGGIACAALSLPCRYLHSGGCLLDWADIEAGYQLVKLAASAFAG